MDERENIDDLFSGPIESAAEGAEERYGRKPDGTSDQGYKED